MSAKILGISGSLRAGSYNTALIRAAGEMLTQMGAEFELAPIDDIPLYNADLGHVEAAERLKLQIGASDSVLIATPEYNHGIPGPLKNAIDWASRPAGDSVFGGKVVGMIGASGGLAGTARAQAQLKQVLLGMLCQVFPHPEILVSRAPGRFKDGTLVDETTREFLATYLDAFVAYTARHG